jgi:hypothetical protein
LQLRLACVGLRIGRIFCFRRSGGGGGKRLSSLGGYTAWGDAEKNRRQADYANFGRSLHSHFNLHKTKTEFHLS